MRYAHLWGLMSQQRTTLRPRWRYAQTANAPCGDPRSRSSTASSRRPAAAATPISASACATRAGACTRGRMRRSSTSAARACRLFYASGSASGRERAGSIHGTRGLAGAAAAARVRCRHPASATRRAGPRPGRSRPCAAAHHGGRDRCRLSARHAAPEPRQAGPAMRIGVVCAAFGELSESFVTTRCVRCAAQATRSPCSRSTSPVTATSPPTARPELVLSRASRAAKLQALAADLAGNPAACARDAAARRRWRAAGERPWSLRAIALLVAEARRRRLEHRARPLRRPCLGRDAPRRGHARCPGEHHGARVRHLPLAHRAPGEAACGRLHDDGLRVQRRAPARPRGARSRRARDRHGR